MKHPKSYDTTPETRRRMSKVKLKNGTAEQLLAKRLWHIGYRYRKNDRRLPGSPDIVISKYKVAVFVDGEFWHGKDWETKKERLQRNRGYWTEKIDENISRDERDEKRLAALGWTVIRFWAGEVLRDVDGCVQTIEAAILEATIQQHEDTYDEVLCGEEDRQAGQCCDNGY